MPALAGGGDRGAALRRSTTACSASPATLAADRPGPGHMQIADYASALGLLDGAVAAARVSRSAHALYVRGHANFDLGNYAEAAADFDATLEGQTTLKDASPLLWRYAAQVRARRTRGGVLTGTRQREPLRMAGPIAKFLLGRCRPASSRSPPNPTTPPRGATASAWPPSSSAWTRAPRRQAARARAAPARPGALPDVSEINWAARVGREPEAAV
jgi:hypothetical protein